MMRRDTGNCSPRIKDAFQREFVTSEAALARTRKRRTRLRLQFDLLPEELRPAAAERLARDVRERKHLTTGFVGTPYLCHVLSRHGYIDEAYMLLNRERVSFLAVPGQAGRDDHLGTLGRPEAGRRRSRIKE